MSNIKIKVLWVGPSTNKIKGAHWGTYKKAKDAAYAACKTALVIQFPEGPPELKTPVEISLQAFIGRGRKMFDTTNYSTSLKMLEDSLVQLGILPNDTPECVKAITIKSPLSFKEWYDGHGSTDSYVVLEIKENK